jgi:hypothetical protein
MKRLPDSGLILGAVAFSAAALFFAAALGRALTYEPIVPAGTDVTPAAFEAPAPSENATTDKAKPLTTEALGLAADQDPFQASRERPGEPYRLPGEFVEPPPPPPELPPPPAFRVLGTAVSPNGGVALLQVADGTPRVVGIGESLSGYTLERVENNAATMSGQGRSLRLAVAPLTPQPARGNARGRGAAGGRGGAEGGRAGRGGAAEAERILQELGARGLNINPEMIERLMMQRGGGGGGADVPVTITTRQNGVTVIRGGVRRDTLVPSVERRIPRNR